MTTPRATVVIPTFDHGPLLGLAVDSALRQSVPVEVFIVGDGVPEAHKAFIRDLTAGDARVRFFDHPKSPGRGEAYRHAALAQARGEIVCYLCDRDLWLADGGLGGSDEQAVVARARASAKWGWNVI